MGLQISIRESADVTILDLQGRATIGADGDLLNSHLQELRARRQHVMNPLALRNM